MTITLAANVSGNMDQQDKRAMLAAIQRANVGRVSQLPSDTAANIKNSYQTILSELIVATHLQNISSVVDISTLKSVGFTQAQIDTMMGNLVDRLQNGESAATIVADTAS